MVLTPAEIRKQNTFKKRRRPRSDRHRGRNPRARGWKQRRPPPVEPGTILARSHAQIEGLGEDLAGGSGGGLSRRAASIVDICVHAASVAVAEHVASAGASSRQDRASRYATATAADAQAGFEQPPLRVNRNGFKLRGGGGHGGSDREAAAAAAAREETMTAAEREAVAFREATAAADAYCAYGAQQPQQQRRGVRLTKAGEAVLSEMPTGAVGLSASEMDELAAMQGLMMDRHAASSWELSDDGESSMENQGARAEIAQLPLCLPCFWY